MPKIVAVDGITYYITGGNSILMDADATLSGAVNIPSIVEGYPVTKINYSAFSCTGITSVTIPDTVLSIGYDAFRDCTSLLTVEMSDSVTVMGASVFQDCNKLMSVKLSENLFALEDGAFNDCDALVSITIPDSVTKIGNNAFSDCDFLKTVKVGSGVKHIGDFAFYYSNRLETINLPEGLTHLGKSAFERCSSLDYIRLPEGLGYISECTFERCSSLREVLIPSTVKYVERMAFSNCDSLKYVYTDDLSAWCKIDFLDNMSNPLCNKGALYVNNVAVNNLVIPEDVSELKMYAFDGCSSIKSIQLHKDIKNISVWAFYNCNIEKICFDKDFSADIGDFLRSISTIKTFVVEDGNKTYYSDGYALYNADKTKLIRYASNNPTTSFDIPDTVTEIGDSSFNNSNNILNIKIPASVKKIGSSAFSSCAKLTQMEIPSEVEDMGAWMFSSCSSLQEVKVFAEISTLPEYIFNWCTSLKTVHLPATITKIEDYAFSSCTPSDIYYGGSNIDWLDVSYNADYNSCLINAAVHYGKLVLPEKIILSNDALEIFKGETDNSLSVSFLPDNTSDDIVWSTSNGDVATVNDGVITGTGLGEAIITATTVNGGLSAQCKVNVVSPHGTSGVVDWNIQDGVLILSGTGSMDSYYYSTAPWVAYASQFNTVVINEGITSIGDRAFQGLTRLVKVHIPESVTFIGASAFASCTSLGSIQLPSNLKTIKGHAFYKCSSLRRVVIPESVTSMDGYVFYFSGVTEVVIEAKLETLYQSTFSGSASLQSVTLPDSLKTISDKVFQSCRSLSKLEIPSGVTSIGKESFYGCSALREIVIPDGVTTIESKLFYDCNNLISVALPSGLREIKSQAFSHCSSLKDINLPDSITALGESAFNSCCNIVSLVIPNGITKLEKHLFNYCIGLESIAIPNSVTTICSNAFNSCNNLKKIAIPNSVTTIESGAFANCIGMQTITIPETVTVMGENIFAGNNQMVVCVFEDSAAYTYVNNNNVINFVIKKTRNPEISYGLGISGTVTYTDGTLASGATVDILYDDGSVKESVKTDENGVYEFTYAEVGSYSLKAHDSTGNTSGGMVHVKRMNVFDVFVAGETDLIMKKGYTVSGTISPEVGSVTLTDIDGNVISTVKTTDGTYAFATVPNGNYIIRAENENGSASKEITVFGSDLTIDKITISSQSATVTGFVEVEDRELKRHRRNWIEVTIYDSEGIAVASQKTDEEGKYTFKNLPLGDYSIVAETSELRPDKKKGYDRPHTLTGYAYVTVEEVIVYEVETIVLFEENDNSAQLSGKVTAQGETQPCEVILRNVFRHEIGKCQTKNNGKYAFGNVPDGLYFITAITPSKGMGMTVIVVRNGEVYGDTDIFVYKHDKIRKHEDIMNSIPYCNNREDALKHKDKIREEKIFYDGLSEKEKKHCSKEYVERLNRLSEWIAECEYTGNGGEITNGGLIISEEELANEDKIELILNVEKTEPHKKNADGIKNDNDFIQHSIEDTAGGNEIVQYYNISLSKNVNGKSFIIKEVAKDTDSTGKVRITIPIPEEYKGHRKYTFIHVHNGTTSTLVDLDDNPDTVTFEIDRFSTFALAYNDLEDPAIHTPGDVNNDTVVDSRDAISLLRFIGGWDLNGAVDTDAIDINGDGISDSCDAILLLRYIAGWGIEIK